MDKDSDIVDEGAGGDVVVTFSIGTRLVFEGLETGEVDSIRDLVANPYDQFIA